MFQWCEDWYRKEMNTEELRKKYTVLDNDGGGEKFRVLRGASWLDNYADYLLSSCRGIYAPGLRGDLIGFRCVLVGMSSR